MKGTTITSLELDRVTMTHHGLEQLGVCLSFSISLVNMNLLEIRCSEHIYGVCIQMVDLQKLNKLKKLRLKYISVEGLLLPVDGVTLTSLELNSVTMTRRGLKQLKKSLSSCRGLVDVDIGTLTCSEDGTNVCIPALNLQKHNALNNLKLVDLSVKRLLLPLKGATISSLELSRVIMTHKGLQQLEKSLSSCPSIVRMDLGTVTCRKHCFDVCIPFLNLQKHSRINKIKLMDLSVKGLLLPSQETTITSLKLDSVTMTHHGLEQLGQSLSSCQSLQNVNLTSVTCSEDIDSVCIPVLDLQTQNKLEKLKLRYISVKGLLLPVEGAMVTSLELRDITMVHHGLEQLMKSLLYSSHPAELNFRTVKCSEHTDSVCIPVMCLQSPHNLQKLELKDIFVDHLPLPVDCRRTTSLILCNVILSHKGLKQLGETSFSLLEDLHLKNVRCKEHGICACIPYLDLRKQKYLKQLMLDNIYFEGLLLPEEGASVTSMSLCSLTITHHGIEQVVNFVKFSSGLEELDVFKVKCVEHDDTVCIPVLNLQKQYNLKRLVLARISVKCLLLPEQGVSITSMSLCNLTITHHGLEQVVKFVSFYPGLETLDVRKVKCVEHDDRVCIPVLDLQKHNNLKRLILEAISVESLLPHKGETTITSLGLYDLTITHHSLEQIVKFVTFCSGLKELDIVKVKCVEHDNTVCIPVVLDLQKHTNQQRLMLDTMSVESLLLPEGEATITSLWLYNLTITHHSLEQVVKFVSFCPGLEELGVQEVKCAEHGDTVCIPVLYLQKHNNLKRLILEAISVESLLLPKGESIITSLGLYDLTIQHHSLEQFLKFATFCTGLEELDIVKVKCVKHDDTVCISALDLQKHNNLKDLMLDTISVTSLLLPEGEATITSLGLYNLTITHDSLEQVVKFVSFCPGLEELGVQELKCAEHGDTVCIPVLDLQKHNKLKRLILASIYVKGLLLPEVGTTITSLCLYNLTITHHSMEQVVKCVSFFPGLEKLDVRKVKCVEHNNTVCIPVLDLQKHNNLKTLVLDTVPGKGLLLPEAGAPITSLGLYNLTITHRSLEQVVLFVSFCPGLEDLDVREVKCLEHDDIVCIPVLDLQKINSMKQLILDTISVERLLLPEGEATITSLCLYNLTITHHSLEQVEAFVSFCSGLEKLDVRKLKCVEHDDRVCIPVLDLQKHNNLKRLVLARISVESLLLHKGEATITSLGLYDLTITQHSLEQIVKFVSLCPSLEELRFDKVKCVEHDDTVCIPALDLQKHNNLKRLLLNNMSVESLLLPEEGATITSLVLYNLIITHHSLEKIVKFVSFYPGLEELDVRGVKCMEHDDTVCIPVLDLQKVINLK